MEKKPPADRSPISFRLPGSIQHQLILLLFIVLVPILFIQGLIYRDRIETRKVQEVNANLELARAVAENFHVFLTGVIRQEAAVGLTLTRFPEITPAGVNAFLEHSKNLFPPLRDLSWANPRGKIIASSREELNGEEVGDFAFFKEIREGKEWSVSNMLPFKGNHDRIFVVSRRIPAGPERPAGVIIATVLQEPLADFLAFRRGKEGSILLLDQRGRVVMAYPPLMESEKEVFQQSPMVRRALTRQELAGTSPLRPDGETYILAFASVPGTDWLACACRKESAAMAPVFSDILTQALLFVLACAGAFLFALLVSRHIAASILQLRQQVREFSRRLSFDPHAFRHPKEIQELSETFAKMAAELRARQEETHKYRAAAEKYREELELRVKARTEELRFHLRKLEQANRDLKDFVFVATHDLQEPARKIRTFLDLIGVKFRKELTPDLLFYFDRLHSSAGRIQEQLKSLIDYAGILEPEAPFQPVDLHAVAGKAARDLAPLADAGNVRLEVGPLATIIADPTQIYLLFYHLIQNGLKFRGAKDPFVRVSGARQGNFYRIRVEDNGIGFDSRYLDRILRPFQKLQPRERYAGTGIGLAICRRVVERHGGRIEAKSSPGRGSVFIVFLPIKKTPG